MSELRLVAEATLSPTSCFRCTSQVGPFVDFSIDHQLEGNLYLCKLCCDGVTRTTGGCSAEEKAAFEVSLADARDEIERLHGAIKDAKREVISDLLAFQKEIVDAPVGQAS